MSNPDPTHFKALNRIWKYLNDPKSKDLALVYKAQSTPTLVSYSNADWGGDFTTRKSTTGYIFFLNKQAPISWRSILQKSVALSSCEAEYIALKETIEEAIFLKDLFKELEIETKAITVYTNSRSAIELANNPEHYAKTKHIDI